MKALAALVFVLGASLPAQTDLFGHTKVRDFYFTFKQLDWWNQLLATQTSQQDIKADLVVDNLTYPDVGIRIKGASSNLMPGNKKPLNLTMDAFTAGQNLYGTTTLNLNNGAMDPTMTREVTAFWIYRNYMPTPRTAYARVHLNSTYWGVYILVEQPNKAMLRQWFRDEDGTRYKGDRPSSVVVESSTLNWLGSSQASYQANYELKTPGHPNAWTDLINFCDKLNNTPDAQFKAEIVKWLDVDRALWFFACNNLLVNSDEYQGAGHNYYMYFDPSDGRMNMMPWDNNEAYGVHGPASNTERYSPTYGDTFSNRPLVRRLLAIPEWREAYFAHYRAVLRKWSDWDTQIGPLTKTLQDSIRVDIQKDPNYFFAQAQFDPTYQRFWWVFHYIPCLKDLAVARRNWLLTLPDLTKPEPAISNVTFATQSVLPGQRIQVTANVAGNPAIQSVTLRSSAVGAYADDAMFDDGQHGDGAANDGVWGGSFQAGNGGLAMRFYVVARNTAGTLAFSPEAAEHEFYSVDVRFPDPTGPIVVNEVLAENDLGDQDENGEFDDWLELYNRGTQAYDVGGHWLTDDPTLPRKWQIPANTVIPAGGFLRVWCDNEPLEGKFHATFKLSQEGEAVALYDVDARNNALLDGIAFGSQKGDRSYGRLPDGHPATYYLWEPTGNAPSLPLGAIRRYDGRRTGSRFDLELRGLGQAQAGQTFLWNITGGPKSGAALLLLSPFPSSLDLGPLGHLGIEPLVLIPIAVPLDANGAVTIPYLVPPALAGVSVFQQAFSQDLSNALAVRFR